MSWLANLGQWQRGRGRCLRLGCAFLSNSVFIIYYSIDAKVFFFSVLNPDSGVLWIRILQIWIQGLKKWSKMLNHHKIILLFTTLPVYLSVDFFWWKNLIRIKWFSYSVRNSLDPDSGVFWIRIEILAGSGFNEYGSETLVFSPL